MRLLKKRVDAFGTKVRGCGFARALPHTLPKNVHPFCASKKPKLLRQQAFPMLDKRRNENRRGVFDFDQTALLPQFSN